MGPPNARPPRRTTMIRPLALLTVCVVAACSSKPTPPADGRSPAAGTEPTTVPGADALSHADIASRFVATPGSSVQSGVEWSTVALVFSFQAVTTYYDMLDPANAESEGAASTEEREKMLVEASQLFSSADFDDQGRQEATRFASEWKGAENCVSTRRQNPWPESAAEDVLAVFPDRLRERLEAVRVADSYDVRCGETSAVVVVDEAGRVVAADIPRRVRPKRGADGESAFIPYVLPFPPSEGADTP